MYDKETDLCLLTYRYYCPAHGSFLTRDPSGAEPNLYAYARQNPVTGHDPSGLADIIAVPGGPYGAPRHEFIHFDLIQCQIQGFNCDSHDPQVNYGFYPKSGIWGPGILNPNATHSDEPIGGGWCGPVNPGGNDPDSGVPGNKPLNPGAAGHSLRFELALCDCIAQSDSALPDYDFPCYCCVNWANDMMRCALNSELTYPNLENGGMDGPYIW